jgi:hypothetical protein
MTPFLLTGMGRSGTQFIAKALNTPNVEVKHEYPNDSQYVGKVVGPRERFHSNYGEVNGMLRTCAPYLGDNGVKVGVIVRDPAYILRSVMQGRAKYRTVRDFYATVKLIEPGIKAVVELVLMKFPFYAYEDLILNKDRTVWETLTSWLEIPDFDYDTIDFSKKLGSNGDEFPIPEYTLWTDTEKLAYEMVLGKYAYILGY